MTNFDEVYKQPVVPNNQKKIYRGVEQLVARRAHNPKVVGSSPAPATTELVVIDLQALFYLTRSFGDRLLYRE